MHEVLSAISACHLLNICHRDLKLENILISKDGKKIKVIDFGLSVKTDEDGSGITGCSGTFYYFAPEVAKNYWSKYEYSKKCDIWSLGIMMYILLKKSYPYVEGD
jgi:serine/threonine protein kinase